MYKSKTQWFIHEDDRATEECADLTGYLCKPKAWKRGRMVPLDLGWGCFCESASEIWPFRFPRTFQASWGAPPLLEKNCPLQSKSSEADAPQAQFLSSSGSASFTAHYLHISSSDNFIMDLPGNSVFSLREKNRLFTERLGRTWVICTGNPRKMCFEWILEACWMEDRIRR